MREVAALFVEEGGAYYGLEGVDPWPESRDARLYRGPYPVVAHPPCNRWAMPLAKVNETRYGHRVGADGGCFEAALRCVQMYGGVLEHPACTAAFCEFGIPKPHRGRWCVVGGSCVVGWTARITEVSQSAYGCPARKRTWLYAVAPSAPELDWSEPEPTMVTSWLQKTPTKLPRLAKRRASRTPPAFRDLLIEIARRAV